VGLSLGVGTMQPSLVSLAFGLFLVPPCGLSLRRLLKCGNAIALFSLAVDTKNKRVADQAKRQVTCIAGANEVLKDA
jgi:hypothetical protein